MALLTGNETTSDDKTRRRFLAVWTWVGAIILVGVCVYMINILAMPIGIIIWSAIFVLVLAGPVDYLEKRGIPRGWGTTIAFVMLVVVLSLFVFLLFSPGVGISDQFNELAAGLPGYFERFVARASEVYNRYADVLQNDDVRQWLSSTISSLGEWAQTLATESAGSVVAAGASIANTLMCIGFALVISFWLLMDLPRLGVEASRLVGEKHAEEAEMFYLTFTRVMGGYIKAMIVQCTVIGVACGILFAVLGVPSPAALGAITGLLNIIPIIGPWLGGGLACLVSMFTSTFAAVAALVGTVIIQQVVYTFVSPKLMSNSVDIHPALTFIALMAGSGIGTAMGGMMGALVGALLSIPAVAVMKSVFVYYFERETGRRIVSEDGVFFKGATEGGEGAPVNPMADATAMAPAPDVQLSEMPLLGKLLEDSSADAAPSDKTDSKHE